jgi:hypothetical protein
VHKTRGQRDPALAFPPANTRDDAFTWVTRAAPA